MKVVCRKLDLQKTKADVLVAGFFTDSQSLSPELASDSLFATTLPSELTGPAGQGTFLHLPQLKNRILLVSLGPKDDFSLANLRRVVAEVARTLQERKLRKAAISIASFVPSGHDVSEVVHVIVETCNLAFYRYLDYKKEEREKSFVPAELLLVFSQEGDVKAGKSAAQRAQIIADSANFARDLQNHPGNYLTPRKLANTAESLAKEWPAISCQVLGPKQIKQHKMGGLLGVSRGSDEPPRFIILEYKSPKSGKNPIVLVGKGVTFDTGGISLKPGANMEEMKFDMSGAAAVFGILRAVAALELPIHVVGLIPATENMPGGTAIKPGDILKISEGTTVEIINTDAEGRLILADALAFARKYKPEAVIDLATLTGACVVALGHHTTGLFGNDQPLIDEIRLAGDVSGERVWQLPLWQEYYDDIKSDYADIKNSAGRPGSAITAAAFLGTFTKDYRWAHLDIAGTAWTTQKKDYFEKGGTAVGVRLLVEFLRRRASK